MKKTFFIFLILPVFFTLSCKDLSNPVFKNTERISLESPNDGASGIDPVTAEFEWEDPDYDTVSNKYKDIGKFRIVIFIFTSFPSAKDDNSGFTTSYDAGISLTEDETKKNTGTMPLSSIYDVEISGDYFDTSTPFSWSNTTYYWVVVGFTNGFVSHSSAAYRFTIP